jgi:hypothetical protein
MLICMRCSGVIDTGYYVSQEEAAISALGVIKGPIICAACYGSSFPNKPLPKPALVNQRVDQPPIMVSESKLSTAGFSSVPPSVVGPSISTGTLLVTATGDPALDQTLADLQLVLVPTRIGYAVHGSCAALMHRAVVKPAPGDIDVLIDTRLVDACTAVTTSGRFKPAVGGSILVKNFSHIATKVEIQLVEAMEFGMPIKNSITIQSVSVLNLCETMISLILRPLRTPGAGSKRGDVNKELFAFFSLCSLRGNELSSGDRQRIVETCPRSPNLKFRDLKSWDQIEALTKDFEKNVLPALLK